MNEHPILFSAPMIRAILDGRKTVTRRVIKANYQSIEERDDGSSWPWREDLDHAEDHWYPCPYGKPGDTLWVRETWRPGAWREDGRVAADYRASPEENRTPWLNVPPDKWEDLYLKLGDEALDALAAGRGSVRRTPDGDFAWDRGDSPCKWRPSIFMPRWASRITLRIKSVRVERLQAISEDDAQAEGIYELPLQEGEQGAWWYSGIASHQCRTPRAAFAALWDSLNAKRGAGWDTNPWVWVIEFAREKLVQLQGRPQIIPEIIPTADVER